MAVVDVMSLDWAGTTAWSKGVSDENLREIDAETVRYPRRFRSEGRISLSRIQTPVHAEMSSRYQRIDIKYELKLS